MRTALLENYRFFAAIVTTALLLLAPGMVLAVVAGSALAALGLVALTWSSAAFLYLTRERA